MPTIDEILAGADHETDTMDVLVKGSLRARHASAVAALEVAQQEHDAAARAGLSVAQTGAARSQAAKAVLDIEQQIKDATLTLTLQAMAPARWQELLRKFPPREGVMADWLRGFNIEEAWPVLIAASIVDVNGQGPMTAEQFGTMVLGMVQGQYDALAERVAEMNMPSDGGAIPFSSSASEVMTSSERTPSSRKRSTAARGGSTAGNRKRSPRTSTTTPAG